MKTSTILFILTLVIGIIAIRFSGSWGNVSLTMDNQPTNALSKFWLQIYDVKVTQELPKSVKHVKLRGESVNLAIHRQDEPCLFSWDPQAFTYSIDADTLIIENMKKYTHIVLRQPVPPEQISLHHVDVFVNGLNQEKLSVAAHDGSSFYTPFNRRDDVGIDSVGHLEVYATGGSSVHVNRLKGSTVSASLDNAVLNYGSTTEVDSVFVLLNGRSTVVSADSTAVNQIGHLAVSGNTAYFKKAFAGKGVGVTIQR